MPIIKLEISKEKEENISLELDQENGFSILEEFSNIVEEELSLSNENDFLKSKLNHSSSIIDSSTSEMEFSFSKMEDNSFSDIENSESKIVDSSSTKRTSSDEEEFSESINLNQSSSFDILDSSELLLEFTDKISNINCYNTCHSCYEGPTKGTGNKINHNCQLCKEGYY